MCKKKKTENQKINKTLAFKIFYKSLKSILNYLCVIQIF
jgi:hypothetical protein